MRLTLMDIEALRTDSGGFTAGTTEGLGLRYPLKSGWRRALVGTEIDPAKYQDILLNRNACRGNRVAVQSPAPLFDAPQAQGRPILWHSSIECDGGCDPNPGRGYGSYRITLDGEPNPIERLDFGWGSTNNSAEYQILIAALEDVIRMTPPELTSISIRSDSKIVIFHAANFRRAKRLKDTPPALQVHKDRLAELLSNFAHIDARWHERKNSVAIFNH